MRIGYVLKKFPRLSETFILNEILGLEAMGHEIEVFTLRTADDEPRHADFARLRAPVRLLDARRAAPDAAEAVADLLDLLPAEPAKVRRRALAQGAQLAELARGGAIEHLHVHFMTGAAQVAAVARALGGPGFSVTCHAKDIFRKDIDAALFRGLAARAARVVTVSEFNRRYIADRFLGGRIDEIVMVPNGMPLDDAAFQPPITPRDRKLILGVGRLVEKKGFDLLLRATARLVASGHDPKVVIVGQGEEQAALAALVEELGLADRVSLVGALPREEVFALMRRARVFALPCREGRDGNRDALPTVLIEALALGLPAVSTRMVGIPEIIDDDVQGRLVPVEDVEALSAALSELLGDDDAFRRMATAAPGKARACFDRSTTLPRLAAVFDDALRRPSTAAEPGP